MATKRPPKKKAKAPSKKRGQQILLKIPVTYGNLNVGDKTASLGVKVDRANLTLGKADNELCQMRVEATITAKPKGVRNADQGSLNGMEDDTSVSGSFDIGNLSVSDKRIGFGLKVGLKGFEVEELAKFAKREGWVEIHASEDIPDEEKEDETKPDEEKTEAGATS